MTSSSSGHPEPLRCMGGQPATVLENYVAVNALLSFFSNGSRGGDPAGMVVP